MVKERRSKIQIFFDIVTAVIDDVQNNESISPTRIQIKCNTSYDKLTKYLEEMTKRGIIENEKSVTVTEKGMQFHKDYSRINELINEINEKFYGSVKTSVPSFAV
jgi:predicted transcriptional regulator